MKIFILFLIALTRITEGESTGSGCDADLRTNEAKLKKKLFCNSYDKKVKPVSNHADSVKLDLDFIVQAFDYFLSPKMVLTSKLILNWTDTNLRWEPQEFENMAKIIVEKDEIWAPSLDQYFGRYNSKSTCTFIYCMIQATGAVKCLTSCTLNAFCESNFKRFPYDTQNCSLSMGQWADIGNEVDIRAKTLTFFSEPARENMQWKIVSSKIYDYKFDDNPPAVCFNFMIERHSGRYSVVLLAPALIMIIINLSASWLQANSLHRIILLAVNIFAHFNFLQQLSWYVPANGAAVPSIVIYFRDSLIITTVLMLSTVFLNACYKKEKTIPFWLEMGVNFVISTNVGEYIFAADYIDSGNMQSLEDDVNLVETSKVPSKNNRLWRQLATIIDRLFFFGILLAYAFMIILLIPEDY